MQTRAAKYSRFINFEYLDFEYSCSEFPIRTDVLYPRMKAKVNGQKMTMFNSMQGDISWQVLAAEISKNPALVTCLIDLNTEQGNDCDSRECIPSEDNNNGNQLSENELKIEIVRRNLEDNAIHYQTKGSRYQE